MVPDGEAMFREIRRVGNYTGLRPTKGLQEAGGLVEQSFQDFAGGLSPAHGVDV